MPTRKDGKLGSKIVALFGGWAWDAADTEIERSTIKPRDGSKSALETQMRELGFI